MSDPKRTAGWPEAAGRVFGRLLWSVLVLYAVIFVVFKTTWDLLVPMLFPGAVEQELVAKTISWWTAFLLSGAVYLVLLWAGWTSSTWFSSASKRIPLLEAKVNAIATHLGIDLDAAIRAEVAALAEAGKKPQAIDLYRNYTGTDLVSAKEYVDGLLRSAAPSVTPPTEPAAPANRPGD